MDSSLLNLFISIMHEIGLLPSDIWNLKSFNILILYDEIFFTAFELKKVVKK